MPLTNHLNHDTVTLKTENSSECYIKVQFLRHRTHSPSQPVAVYGSKRAVCSEDNMKHINTLYGQNAELLSVIAGGTIDLKRLITQLTG